MERKSLLAFEDHGRGMLFVARGVVSGAELLKRNRKTYTPDVLAQLRYQIVDLRELDRLDISTQQMQELAALDRQAAESIASPSALRVAIVVNHDLTEGLARIYCAYARSPRLEAQVFADLDAARNWAQSLTGPDNSPAQLCL